MTLPTAEELIAAWDGTAHDNELCQLDDFCAKCPPIQRLIHQMDEWPGSREGLTRLLNIAFVAGLHLGIRVGEKRGGQSL